MSTALSPSPSSKQENLKPPALCLLGPTACGKTQVAVELAQEGPFDIISVDSALVYRGLVIGAGKPDAATLAKAPHRLIDLRDPSEPYSAADFRADALRAIAEIHAQGRIPLLVGGTMLYFKALRDGLATLPSAAPALRQRILDLAQAEGWPAVHERLAAVDPRAAARIRPTDPQRLQRALEVYELTGVPLSAHHAGQQRGQTLDLPCTLHFVGMIPEDRSRLHERIARRFQQMLAHGLVEEVRRLHARGDLDPNLPALRSVGYRQVWQYLEQRCSYDEMVAAAIAATRQLAKRQLTWLRSWPQLTPLRCNLQNDGAEDTNSVKHYLKNLRSITNYC
ncbi:MAG: tRNA (adenosine(37)-N6)-dimethylallyltransferase MiaA [Pseudomonadales bacterium]|nr:tRNA (adenosine(37)-N6)-dimethylallyltransferase MiaA [Pseudomonadales bacterium]